MQPGTIVVGDFDPTPTTGAIGAGSVTYQNLFGADPFDAKAYPSTTQAALVTSNVVTVPQSILPGYFGITCPRNFALLPCIKY